ncbi:sulfotransferase [Halobacillus salinarum]|uniref:Sulfotransferase n=1 Tax=Halobacillus salinarum TaxID=2932257 RepID=A0ABY4EML9_9BACI|nr:sulfotransferase [Halobacillus salinarum]UOQ45696.1 sulfotransferase [Halobacillus salinarum]
MTTLKKLLRKVYHLPHNIKRARLNKISKVHEHPIFVIGNQKSGTSAIGALLADISGKSVAIDLPGILEPNQLKIHNKEISFPEFIERNKYDFSKEVIKEPSLTFLYEEVHDYFPESQFVFIVRDPRDNIRSILNRVNIMGNLETIDDPDSRRKLAKAPKDWERVIDSRWLGMEGDNYIEWMAHRWNYAIDIYKKHEEQMLLIRYEDFVKDKEAQIASLARKLGLEAINDISSKVDIQYQPAGNKKVNKLEFFGEENLKKIETICGPKMEEFGYQPKLVK